MKSTELVLYIVFVIQFLGWSGLSQQDRVVLADSLEYNDCKSLKRFIAECDYVGSHEKHLILYNLSPSHSFFENLVCSRPQTRLAEIKEVIESKLQNKAIFAKVERAIMDCEVTFDLEYTLLQLKADDKHWTYILDHVASELVAQECYGLPTWKDVADSFDYSNETIKMIETRNLCDERPTFKLLRLLYERQPKLDIISYLVEILTKIQRLDVIQKCNLA